MTVLICALCTSGCTKSGTQGFFYDLFGSNESVGPSLTPSVPTNFGSETNANAQNLKNNATEMAKTKCDSPDAKKVPTHFEESQIDGKCLGDIIRNDAQNQLRFAKTPVGIDYLKWVAANPTATQAIEVLNRALAVEKYNQEITDRDNALRIRMMQMNSGGGY